MNKEIKYLKTLITDLEFRINLYSGHTGEDRLSKAYASMVDNHKEEKQLLENVLNVVTINAIKCNDCGFVITEGESKMFNGLCDNCHEQEFDN